MCLARCVREMWSSKYGTVDSALKLAKTPGHLPPFRTSSPKITIADVCPPDLLDVRDDERGRCLGQMPDHGLCMDMRVNRCKIRRMHRRVIDSVGAAPRV